MLEAINWFSFSSLTPYTNTGLAQMLLFARDLTFHVVEKLLEAFHLFNIERPARRRLDAQNWLLYEHSQYSIAAIDNPYTYLT
jgi:hypothetical protein